MGGGDGGLCGALSAQLVQHWQVKWQGLHLEVGGLSTDHWHWIGVPGSSVWACVCAFMHVCFCECVRVCLFVCTSAHTWEHMLMHASFVCIAVPLGV